jgi:hypothetical protein
MHVYVKRVVPGSPADRGVSDPPGHRISPGDSLLLINGEDVYGLGLDILRDRIPGPSGSFVVLGFKSLAGDLFEVELQRREFGPGPSQEPRRQQRPSNQSDDGVIRAPRNRTAPLRNPPSRMHPPGGENGHAEPSPGSARGPGPSNSAPQGEARRPPAPARTTQAPMMAPPSLPMGMDQMQAGPRLAHGAFFGGDAQFIAVGPGGQALQYQYGAGYGHQPPSFHPMQQMQQQMQQQQQQQIQQQMQQQQQIQQQQQQQQQQMQQMRQMQQQFSAQFQVAAPFGQGPPQYGPGPGLPQVVPMPMPMVQAPPGHGMGQPHFAQMQPHFFQ